MRIAVLASLLVLAACGFHPVYGTNKYTANGVEEKLQLIEIGNIPDREGQYLRNALIDRFYRNGRPLAPVYQLNIQEIEESTSGLDVSKSADTTRAQLRLSTSFTLTNTRTGEEVIDRSLRSITSYNQLGSEFATRVSEESTRANALDDLARQIEQQVTLYFKRMQ